MATEIETPKGMIVIFHKEEVDGGEVMHGGPWFFEVEGKPGWGSRGWKTKKEAMMAARRWAWKGSTGPHRNPERWRRPVYRIGDLVEVTGGTVMGGKIAKVVRPFNWRLEQGAYHPVKKGWVYLQVVGPGGELGELFTMPFNYITKIEGVQTQRNPVGGQKVKQLDTFTRAYIEAALWSSHDESGKGEFLDQNYGIGDIDPKTLAAMTRDAEEFQKKHWDDIQGNLGHAGHDLWLTRNGHGAGYWSGDYPEPAATRLTKAAHRLGEYNLYVGDDGLIYGTR